MKTIQLLSLSLALAVGSLNLVSAQQLPLKQMPTPGTKAYKIAKKNGDLNAFQLQSIPSLQKNNNARQGLLSPIIENMSTGCYIPHDVETYTMIPRNDDDSSDEIILPFTFNMYGTEYTSVYVNNNGNITFDEALYTYTADGFPIETPMIAPFWADVDTYGNGSDVVWYKVTPHALYVNYPGVGYYDEAFDKLNTFQVIITDGTDPIIGIGNNVAFYYGDMQWTTGDASDGTDGFGGTPATVGVNSGDNTNFFQIGRFVQPGDNFNGAYDMDGGVDWLDYKCFVFNVNSESTSNIPPILLNISSSSETICEGESTEINFTFTGPEAGQDVTVSLVDPSETGSSITTNMEGGSTSGVLTLTGATAGSYNLQLVATDNGEPAETTTINIELNIEVCEEFECPALNLNIGDTCDDGNASTENDVVTEDCECAGTPIIVEPEFECPSLQANIGDSCDDANPMTENDVVTDDCECMGTPIVDPDECVAPTEITLERLSPTSIAISTNVEVWSMYVDIFNNPPSFNSRTKSVWTKLRNTYVNNNLVPNRTYYLWFRTNCPENELSEYTELYTVEPWTVASSKSNANIRINQNDESLVNVHVFPNPTYNELNINGIDAQKVKIFDSNGYAIFSGRVYNNQLNLRQLKTGVYTLIITDENNREHSVQIIKR